MKIMNSGFPSIEQLTDEYLPGSSSLKKTNADTESFADVFERKQANENIRFSKHASVRLSDRNIELTDSQIDRLNAGTQQAGKKGINESLVLVDQLAFIVNVKNNTVITAMDSSDADENVYTNIDGAVIA